MVTDGPENIKTTVNEISANNDYILLKLHIFIRLPSCLSHQIENICKKSRTAKARTFTDDREQAATVQRSYNHRNSQAAHAYQPPDAT